MLRGCVMSTLITEECINCGACEPECPNTAIYEGGAAWELSGGPHPALRGEQHPEHLTRTADAPGKKMAGGRRAVAEAAVAGEETAVDTPALGLRPAATLEGSLQPATLKELPHDVTPSTTEEQVEETEPPESTPPRDLDAPATEPTEDAGPEPEPAALLQDTAPLPEEPIPPLPPGALIAGRFQIIEVLEPGIEVNLYSVHDLAICPVCSFEGNQPEDEFCSECGAELKSTGPPAMCTIREALTPDTLGVEPNEAIFHNGRFYLLLEEDMVAVPEVEPAFPYGMTLSVGYASDVGIVRDLDEDSLCVFTLSGVYESVAEPTMGLFIVADGMGGHEGGEVASKLTVQIIANQLIRNVLLRRFTEEEQPLGEAVRDHLEGAISDANERVFHLARERANDMGCTLTMALVLDGKAYIANVGDSRTYIRGQEGLRQITTDHSVVASLIAAGMAEPEELYTHPDRHVVYRAIGTKPTIEVDIWEEGLVPGDTLLLCCDGLWEAIRNEGIEEVLLTQFDPQAACDEMIRRANQAGGDDNISAILVKVGAVMPAEKPESRPEVVGEA